MLSRAQIKYTSITVCAGMLLMLAAAIYLYRLTAASGAVVMCAGVICVPFIVLKLLWQIRENIRFNQVDIYLHQMAYSFQRSPKVSMALYDTKQIAEGRLGKIIGEAIRVLESDNSRDVYYEALGLIEKEYDCERVRMLNRFIIGVEENGGRYKNSLEVLMVDVDRWVSRVYKHQDDLKHLKCNAIIGVILSGLVAYMSVMISGMLKGTVGRELDITGDITYQAVCVAYIIGCILFFVYTQVSYSNNWLKDKRSDKQILKDYNMYFKRESISVRIAGVCMALSILAIGVALGLWLNRSFIFAGVILAVLLLGVPAMNRASAIKRLREDVYTGFSQWLRDVVVGLSQAPLQAAIIDSFATCPVVIKPSLNRFIMALENNPSDVTCYYDFLKEFGILDVSSTVKTLYAIAENQEVSADSTINDLIRRNYELIDKHENIKNRDSISVRSFGEYIPMMLVSVKLGIDMLLVIENYL